MFENPGSPPILEVHNLHKAYGKVKAVDGISFSVRSGSCFGILGPNGAGKTTAIEVIETIHEADSGTILYRGEAVAHSFKENIGIQFQDTSLQEFLTVRETLELFSKLYPKPRPIDEIIEACSLAEFIDRDNRKLSGGQRQRMLLGIALINDPDLLFLDEPTTGLDPHARRNFWRLIEGIKAQGKTVILTTHYMDEAEYLCDEIIVMDHGRIIESGRPRELLLKHFGEAVIRVPAAALPEGATFSCAPTNEDGFMTFNCPDTDATLRELVDNAKDLSGISVERRNLDDLFLKLTGARLD
ncbi:MAG TPA: ABC transporter ATP-binding protein [Rectinemataceae bacterium]|nr:ABC transporter ATP-binding protein [Rectinemataceae bacterium]